jgi:uncharacterized protein (TIGR02246 family)
MKREDILTIINQIVAACSNKKAADFAALFANNGEIILEKDHRISQPQIEQVTGDYFANLEYIKIKINDILIGENKALIEWVWEDLNSQTKQKKYHENLIYLKFEQNLIIYWREYPV